ncbi:MAG: toll/interleukin-1 receptor domain-containing protein [Pseudonocardiaceae bacterium]
MTTDVFVSHSSADRVLAEAIVHVLEMAGIGCWIAPRNIVPGVNYGEAIVAAIQEVEVMVVVVSDDANRSGHVPREVERAAAHNSHAKPRRVPAPVAVFTGRAAERAEIHRQLAEFPVVTLVGPPGAGKTELARVVPTELPRAPWPTWISPCSASGARWPRRWREPSGSTRWPRGMRRSTRSVPRMRCSSWTTRRRHWLSMRTISDDPCVISSTDAGTAASSPRPVSAWGSTVLSRSSASARSCHRTRRPC